MSSKTKGNEGADRLAQRQQTRRALAGAIGLHLSPHGKRTLQNLDAQAGALPHTNLGTVTPTAYGSSITCTESWQDAR